jgi:hypothetical protein
MISLSQRPYAGQHTILTTDRHQCPRRYSNPQYHPASGCRPTSKTAQPLGPACLVDWLSLCHCSQTTVKIKLKMPIFFTGRYCCCVYPCIVLGFSSLNFNWLYCVCVCVCVFCAIWLVATGNEIFNWTIPKHHVSSPPPPDEVMSQYHSRLLCWALTRIIICCIHNLYYGMRRNACISSSRMLHGVVHN